MRDYEIVYIFRSNFTSEEIEAKLERYHSIVTEGGKGEVTALVLWGKRRLAYPIQKHLNGYYVVAQFAAQPESLTELERVLKLEDDLLRYLVVLRVGEMPLPESAMRTVGDAPEDGVDGAKDTGPDDVEHANTTHEVGAESEDKEDEVTEESEDKEDEVTEESEDKEDEVTEESEDKED